MEMILRESEIIGKFHRSSSCSRSGNYLSSRISKDISRLPESFVVNYIHQSYASFCHIGINISSYKIYELLPCNKIPRSIPLLICFGSYEFYFNTMLQSFVCAIFFCFNSGFISYFICLLSHLFTF